MSVDVLEWERTSLALGKPVDVSAVLDALEETEKTLEEAEKAADRDAFYVELLEEALIDLARAIEAAAHVDLAPAAKEALEAIPAPRRLALLEKG